MHLQTCLSFVRHQTIANYLVTKSYLTILAEQSISIRK